MAISLFEVASAIEVIFNSPEEIEVGEEFQVTIGSETSEVYDVKVYVGEINVYLSKIYRDGAWKSPHLYIQSAFPSQREFSVMVENFTGNNQLCVQLRKNGQTNFDKLCKPISVKENEESPDLNREEQEEENEEDERPSFIPLEENIYLENIENNEKNEKIVLRGRQEDKIDKDTIFSGEGKAQRYVMWVFVVFMFFVAIFIIFRKL